MADFYGTLLSSSFCVRNLRKFLADPEVKWLIEFVRGEGGFFDQNGKYFAFGYDGQYPSLLLSRWKDGNHEDEETADVADIIQRHIHPKCACKIVVSGNEKLRSNGGDIVYVTAEGWLYLNGGVYWELKYTVDSLRGQLLRQREDISELLMALDAKEAKL